MSKKKTENEEMLIVKCWKCGEAFVLECESVEKGRESLMEVGCPFCGCKWEKHVEMEEGETIQDVGRRIG